MTYHSAVGSVPMDHPAAFPQEYEGRTPADAATPEIAAQNAAHTIEEVMRAERKRRARDGLPDLVLPDSLAAGPRGRGTGRDGGVLARLLCWRPGVEHGAWAAAFVTVLIWPRAVLIGLFAGFVICLVGVALFGPDILEHLRARAVRMFTRRDRARVARVRRSEAEDDAMPDPRPDRFERLHDLRG